MTRRLSLGADLRHQIERVFPKIDDIVLYINSACNLRCRHCYIGNSLLSANNAFSANDVCDFIEQFDRLSRITILGGEPLMHRGINSVMTSALRIPISDRRLTTNLTSFFFLDRAKFSGAAFTFAVSLDGHNAGLHDYIRGGGSFDRTVANLSVLVAEGFDVEISHTITTHNINHFDQLVVLCKNLGIEKLNLHKMSLQGNAMDNPDLLVKPARWIEFCRVLQTSRGESAAERRLRVRYPPTYATMQDFARMIEAGEYWGHKQRSYYAEDDGRRIVLYPNGRVYISSELFGTDSHIGTVADGSFRRNPSPQNELSATNKAHDPLMLARLRAGVQGDEQYPALLSVSFKKLAYV